LPLERQTVSPVFPNEWYSALNSPKPYSVSELAQLSNLSTDLIRRIFVDCPGVLVIKIPRKRKRIYRTLRIPAPVAREVFKNLTNGGVA
jgi:hypothetical protein